MQLALIPTRLSHKSADDGRSWGRDYSTSIGSETERRPPEGLKSTLPYSTTLVQRQHRRQDMERTARGAAGRKLCVPRVVIIAHDVIIRLCALGCVEDD